MLWHSPSPLTGGMLLNLDYHLRFDDQNYNHKPGIGYNQDGRYLNGIIPILR